MSQYASSITGEVVHNLRCINNKLYDLIQDTFTYTFTPADNKDEYDQAAIDTSVHPSFSSGSLFLVQNILQINKSFTASTNWTMSFWFRYGVNRQEVFDSYYLAFASLIYKTNPLNQITLFPAAFNKSLGSFAYCDYYTNGAEAQISNKPTIPSINEWHHFAMVKQGSSAKIYIDGVYSATLSLNSTFISINDNSTANSVQLGISPGLSNQQYAYMPVWFDDLVVINNQVLWTDNFTPPTDYLTGAYTSEPQSSQRILLPSNTPTITGDVMINIRGIGKKLYNIGSNKVIVRKGCNVLIDNSITKYSDCCLKTTNSNTNMEVRFKPIDTVPPSSVSKWTFAFWYYTKNSLYSGSWKYSGLSLYSNVTNDGNNGAHYYLYPNFGSGVGLYYQATEQRNSNDISLIQGNQSGQPGSYRAMQQQPINSWNYYTMTRNDDYFYFFKDGVLLVSYPVLTETLYSPFSLVPQNMGTEDYFDDIIYIENQCLWTNDFALPNTYILGDSSTLRKRRIYPIDYNKHNVFLYE